MLAELIRTNYLLVPSNNTASVKFAIIMSGTSTDLPDHIDQVKDLAASLEPSGAFLTMLASEPVLARDWMTPEEDEAWAHL